MLMPEVSRALAERLSGSMSKMTVGIASVGMAYPGADLTVLVRL